MTLILLPPSETKRTGGVERSSLALRGLRHRELTSHRSTVIDRLVSVCAEPDQGARALRVSERAAPAALARNRELRHSPTMPALERYTGVLYDALELDDWDTASRERAAEHVQIHSALWGLLGAADPIPAYRLSHDSRLPGLRLSSHWSEPIGRVLARHPGPILDLRSTGYVALGPLPERQDALFVRVVSEGPDGVARALNHVNKRGKGEFVRAMLTSGPLPTSIECIIALAGSLGWELRHGSPGELELVVRNP